jgi:hydrogenase nickel incorporation protein HypA/HybF
MHELSIATSIVDMAREKAEELGGRVWAVHLKLGPLSGVVKDALLFSYGIACQDTPLDGSTLVVEDAPLVVFCPRCDQQRVLGAARALRCPECGTPTPDVVGGRELELVSLEIGE